MNFVSLYVTTATRREAQKIGRDLVRGRLAACVNILGPIRSVYRWKGKLCDSREVAMLVKTRAALADEVIARVKALHSYDVPCIVVLPIRKGYPAFLKWMADETRAVTARSDGTARRPARSPTSRRP